MYNVHMCNEVLLQPQRQVKVPAMYINFVFKILRFT